MRNNLFLILVTWFISISAYSFDKDKLNQYLENLESHEKSMLSLAIVKNGQPIYQKSIGFSEVDSEQKANENTKYRIGSLTKMFTATMIFQLIDEGKLTLDTKLSKFYPKVKNAQTITISMLLNHRSGIHNYLDNAEDVQSLTQPKTRVEMIRLLEELNSDFKPNSKAEYSNSGYVLLGFIVEDVTGDSYASQLQKRITNKLHLKSTFLSIYSDENDNLAKSYKYNGSAWSSTSLTDISSLLGAGGIISTPTDVALFLSNLFSGRLVSSESLLKMTESNQGVGRGLSRFPFMDKTAYGHFGNIDGFLSGAGYFESDDVAFALTSNASNYSMDDINVAVLSIYYGFDYEIPDFDQAPFTLPIHDLVKYEGEFSSKEIPLKITVKLVGDDLTGQATGQRAFHLTPVSTSEFRYVPWGIRLIFATDGEKVDYSKFILSQSGQSFKYTKE